VDQAIRSNLTRLERAVRAALGLSVSLLLWPAEDDLRRHMSAIGQPRILVIDGDAQPPDLLDPLEDWVRAPAADVDVAARARVLLARAPSGVRPPPTLDEDGLLHVGAGWVVIPPAQVPLMRVLLDSLDRVVRTDAVAAACAAGGASGHPASVRTVIARLGARIRPLGLELATVRQRGVMLRQASV
jgi:hypothetical protein